jgi:acetyltransferase-like isoleucine patch superfamily enzyme
LPIVSANIRVRVPEHLIVGQDSIIDDFCYISTRLTIGRGTHIASGCSIAGGAEFHCRIGDFCSLSSGVRVWCASNDFVNDLIVIVPDGIATSAAEGDVEIGNYSGVGANSVILPDNHLPEGTAIGALSLVTAGFKFEPWTVYAGIPIRPIRKRNRERVMEQVRQLTAQARP